MNIPIKKQIDVYNLLDARASITGTGIEDIIEPITWDKLQQIGEMLFWEDGSILPEDDREVIALQELEFDGYKVVFAHRPMEYDAKSLSDGKIHHYIPETYNGWNIPNIRYWLNLKLPYENV